MRRCVDYSEAGYPGVWERCAGKRGGGRIGGWGGYKRVGESTLIPQLLSTPIPFLRFSLTFSSPSHPSFNLLFSFHLLAVVGESSLSSLSSTMCSTIWTRLWISGRRRTSLTSLTVTQVSILLLLPVILVRTHFDFFRNPLRRGFPVSP